MKNLLNNKIKILIAFIAGGIISSSIIVYATSTLGSNQITYGAKTVDQVVDTLFERLNSDCRTGEVICDDNCVSSTGITLANFSPSFYMIADLTDDSHGNWINLYDYNTWRDLGVGTDKGVWAILGLKSTPTFGFADASSYIDYNNKLRIYSWGSDYKNHRVKYIVCR